MCANPSDFLADQMSGCGCADSGAVEVFWGDDRLEEAGDWAADRHPARGKLEARRASGAA